MKDINKVKALFLILILHFLVQTIIRFIDYPILSLILSSKLNEFVKLANTNSIPIKIRN
jgi:hypothetical protein